MLKFLCALAVVLFFMGTGKKRRKYFHLRQVSLVLCCVLLIVSWTSLEADAKAVRFLVSEDADFDSGETARHSAQIFATHQPEQDTLPLSEETTEEEKIMPAEEKEDQLEQEQPKEEKKACTSTEIPNNGRILWVGDSRTVQLEIIMDMRPDLSEGLEDLYFCKGSMGYQYFIETVLPEVNAILSDDDVIVMNFGVNDLANINAYIETMNDLVSEGGAWHNNKVIYMSVNPVDDQLSRWVKNSHIEAFNAELQQGLDPSIIYLDSYSALFSMDEFWQEMDAEGVHYSVPTENGYISYPYLYSMVRNMTFEDECEPAV